MDGIMIALVIISILVAGFGFLDLYEIEFGLGLIGIAGLLAIFARMAQAAHYQKEVKALLKKSSDT